MFDYRNRQRRLFADLKKRGSIPFLVSSSTDIRYLSGFTGTDAYLLLSGKGVIFGTDGRYDVQSRLEVESDEIFIYGKKRDFFRKFFKKGQNVYFDREELSWGDYEVYSKWGVVPRPFISHVSRMRMEKDSKEIEIIEQAVILASSAFMVTLNSLNGNISEKEFAATMEFEMKKRGAEGSSFPPIVACGEKSAMPHAMPADTMTDSARLILFDYGCRYRGYCSDETVTLVMNEKKIDRELKTVMDVVMRARDAAVRMLKPGVSCRDVDSAARKIIDRKGYGKYFVHSTGHGVGLEIHEMPHISRYSRDVLKKGMVITIEPGIYIPGKGGVRLEDLFVITEKGYRKLTYLPKDGRNTLP